MINLIRTSLCWLVHLFTVSSAILGLWAVQYLFTGNINTAFILILITIIIDSIDGPMARWLDVSHYTPNFDGALLDNVVDFFTWVLVPCLLLMTHPLFSFTTTIVLITAIVVAAGYQFCCKDAKVVGHYFKRYPSAWSGCILAMYLVNWPSGLLLCILIFFVIFSFIPVYSPKAFTPAIICWSPRLNRVLQITNALNQLLILFVLIIGSLVFPNKLVISSLLLALFLIISFTIQLITTHHQVQK